MLRRRAFASSAVKSAAAPTVRGDADLLLDLLCNLVQNAAKASAPGAPVLVLCAQAGDAVTLTVADRGCGIPPEQLGTVFDRYCHGFDTGSLYAGAGLGLTVARSVAQLHKGTLLLESRRDRGRPAGVVMAP